MVLAMLSLAATMALLMIGGRIERALERRFWSSEIGHRPQDDEH
jgi:hypothetical protein